MICLAVGGLHVQPSLLTPAAGQTAISLDTCCATRRFLLDSELAPRTETVRTVLRGDNCSHRCTLRSSVPVSADQTSRPLMCTSYCTYISNTSNQVYDFSPGFKHLLSSPKASLFLFGFFFPGNSIVMIQTSETRQFKVFFNCSLFFKFNI